MDSSYTIRFFDKVDKSGDCWEWLAYKNRRGYGQFKLNGKMERAHRVSWSFHNNAEIPEGMEVCHRCDNPSCVNPKHLFIGTHSKNIKDSFDKNRSTNEGESNPHNKLTRKDIVKLRKEYGSKTFKRGEKMKFYEHKAKFYGVSSTQIRQAISGRAWSCV